MSFLDFTITITTTRVADPVGVYLDQDPTYEKEPNLLEKKPGSGSTFIKTCILYKIEKNTHIFAHTHTVQD